MSDTTLTACPISSERINENVARTLAFLVIAVVLIGFYAASWPVFLLLAFDFAARAFDHGRFSLLRPVALQISQRLGLPEKPVDAAPKKFAAGVGLVFSLVIGLLLTLKWLFAAWVAGGILLACALLEGAVGYCVGCVVYSAMVLPLLRPPPNTL
jgi:hypothetical protein